MDQMFSCREKKDAEICSLEGERNRELEELKELEDANQKIRERVENMARQYNRYPIGFPLNGFLGTWL